MQSNSTKHPDTVAPETPKPEEDDYSGGRPLDAWKDDLEAAIQDALAARLGAS